MFKITDREKITSELSLKSNANLKYVSDTFRNYLEDLMRGAEPENSDYRMFSRTGEPMSFVVGNACIYGTDGKLFKSPDGKYRVKWVENPAGFERDGKWWKVITDEESSVSDIIIPKSGFVEFTGDGLYNPVTGIPFSTVKDWADAVESWKSEGLDRELSEKMVSYFVSGDTYPEARCVGKWSGASKASGPYEIDVNINPGFAGQNMGALLLKDDDSF